MEKFWLTYSERAAITYLIEAENEEAAWEAEVFDCDIYKREIVANELVSVKLAEPFRGYFGEI